MGCAPSKQPAPTTINSKPDENKIHKKTSSMRTEGDESPRENDIFLAPVVAPRSVDARLRLTERQLYSIKRSWKGISRDMATTGVNMFVRLFETNSELKDQFEQFRHLKDVSDLRESKTLVNHATLVMCTIDEAINNLDDVPYVVEMLQKIGRTHRRFPKFQPDVFYKIEEPFLLATNETLQDRYTFSMEAAYKRLVRFILDNLVDGFRN